MPNESFGKDLFQAINDRVRKTDVDTIPDSKERILTLTIDFPSVDEFKNFAGRGNEWMGSQKERDWLGKEINTYDEVAGAQPISITSRTYKDTVFDERGMVAVIIKYILKGN